MSKGVALVCLCCGRTETFSSNRAAYEVGWDVAPYFTVSPICDRCPSSYYMLGETCDHGWTPERYATELQKMQADPQARARLEELAAAVEPVAPEAAAKLRQLNNGEIS